MYTINKLFLSQSLSNTIAEQLQRIASLQYKSIVYGTANTMILIISIIINNHSSCWRVDGKKSQFIWPKIQLREYLSLNVINRLPTGRISSFRHFPAP